ncbi:hypothetical protein FGG08_005795 [Glutinoglossum americanum]|uniref:PH domain-containing protein n=1 Tax=Glutinoglossum americanum TaxID=1670608 RepID=A0A9P8L1I2_9PEZI|nr:hypothetical protein FGG08_005795 [Glutinoglossum americanum]
MLFESDIWRSVGTGAQGGEPGPRLRSFLSFAQLLRRSTTNYEPSMPGYLFPNSSTSQLPGTVPPSYDASNLQGLPPPRFNVIPREEEGRECLPAYSCSIRREAVFVRKMEFRSPFERACDRAWFRVYVVLDGTMLKICRVRTTTFAGRASVDEAEENPDLPIAASAGMVLKTYTLQHAEVGHAADYTNTFNRRSYVIRLRVETDQFLLSCNTVETFLDWLESLSAAINLALPLEERLLPRFRVVPRYHIRQLAATQQESVSQQETIASHVSSGNLRRRAISNLERRCGLGDSSRRSTNAQLGQSTEAERPCGITSSQRSIEETGFRESSTTIPSGLPSRQPSVSSPSVNGSSSSLPVSDPLPECGQETRQDDGKWRPPHRWTTARDIRYAQRCMAILCGDTPRQSDLIIKDGKRWKINWVEERLVPQKEKAPKLPKYGEIARGSVRV